MHFSKKEESNTKIRLVNRISNWSDEIGVFLRLKSKVDNDLSLKFINLSYLSLFLRRRRFGSGMKRKEMKRKEKKRKEKKRKEKIPLNVFRKHNDSCL
ncbi:hypothetical protein I6N90_20230 [Paenibacillus sp. GSMTC-2017]|nr:hypothetical protein [Paenibacillus sp. GSMTC-2017]